PWFAESRSSRHNPKRDWYIWRDGKNGGPPNNWQSIFNESAWTFDDTTGQYFLHLFSAKQPDLNWENPDVRQALYAMVRWWLDKGVDGFRIDAITHIKKDAGLPDMPNPDGLKTVPSLPRHLNRPGIQDYIRELCEQAFAGYDIMTVGEANGVSVDDAPNWVAPEQHKFNMLFQFEQLKLWGSDNQLNLNLPQLKKTLRRWQQGLDGQGWNALFVENHDLPRIVSSWGNTEVHWRDSATAIATLYFLMQGTPFIYQGQELGMVNYPFSQLDEFDDVAIHNLAQQRYDEGWSHDDILNTVRDSARDNSRTPMHWDDTPHAGFTRGTPWLPAHPNHPDINVKHQTADPASVLNYYKALIQLRREHDTLIYGQFELLLEDHPQVFAYQRTLAEQCYQVICNLSDQPADISELGSDSLQADSLLSNLTGTATPGELKPFEARVVQFR
ncbi:MAG: alpha-amylase family glycosyl hydrolase, partial [Pseudohongiellaceae bacterium]